MPTIISFLNRLKETINSKNYKKFRHHLHNNNYIVNIEKIYKINKKIYHTYIININCLEFNLLYNYDIHQKCNEIFYNIKNILLLNISLTDAEINEISSITL